MKIYEQLANVQHELKCNKSLYNSFGKYSYRSTELIMEAVKPLLFENDLCLIITDNVELIGDRFYIKATATIYNKEGEQISTTAYAREEEVKKGNKNAMTLHKLLYQSYPRPNGTFIRVPKPNLFPYKIFPPFD